MSAPRVRGRQRAEADQEQPGRVLGTPRVTFLPLCGDPQAGDEPVRIGPAPQQNAPAWPGGVERLEVATLLNTSAA